MIPVRFPESNAVLALAAELANSQHSHGKTAEAAEQWRRERDALASECNEQARLNGMGAERELALMAKVNALAAELAAMRSDRQREHDLRVRLAGTVEALEAALQRYGTHETDCPMYRRGPVAEVSCTCGFEAVCGFALDRGVEHG